MTRKPASRRSTTASPRASGWAPAAVRLSRRKLTGGEIRYGTPHVITISAHLSEAERLRDAAPRGRARLGLRPARRARGARSAVPAAGAPARSQGRPCPCHGGAVGLPGAPADPLPLPGVLHGVSPVSRLPRSTPLRRLPSRGAALAPAASDRLTRCPPSPRATASGTAPTHEDGPAARSSSRLPARPPRSTCGAARRERARRASSRPGNLVSEIHGLLFTGGSAFGLAAAAGVTSWLRRRQIGFPVGPARVPIVAAAVLFDLAVGDPEAFPGEARRRARLRGRARRRDRDRSGRRRHGRDGRQAPRASAVPRAAGSGAPRSSCPAASRSPRSRRSTPSATSSIRPTGRRIAGPSDRPASFLSARALWEDPLPEARRPEATRPSSASRRRSPSIAGALKRDRDRGARRRRPSRATRAHRRRRRRRLRARAGGERSGARGPAARRCRRGGGRGARHRRRGRPRAPGTAPLSAAGKSERRGAMLVAAAALLWSAGGVGIKAVDEPALKIAFYRSAFAAVALLLLFRPLRLPRGLSSLAAVACYAGCLITFVVATKWTTAANAIFLQFTGVVWVLIAAPLILKEPRRRADTWAIAVAMGGHGALLRRQARDAQHRRRPDGPPLEPPLRLPRHFAAARARRRRGSRS